MRCSDNILGEEEKDEWKRRRSSGMEWSRGWYRKQWIKTEEEEEEG